MIAINDVNPLKLLLNRFPYDLGFSRPPRDVNEIRLAARLIDHLIDHSELYGGGYYFG